MPIHFLYLHQRSRSIPSCHAEGTAGFPGARCTHRQSGKCRAQAGGHDELQAGHCQKDWCCTGELLDLSWELTAGSKMHFDRLVCSVFLCPLYRAGLQTLMVAQRERRISKPCSLRHERLQTCARIPKKETTHYALLERLLLWLPSYLSSEDSKLMTSKVKPIQIILGFCF